MKKKIVTIALIFGMVVSSYALTISTGGYFNLGGNDSSRIETNGISYGVGAFFNIDLFLGLGLQSEINCTNSVINTGENQIIISDIDTIVDIPFMFWWNGKFGGNVIIFTEKLESFIDSKVSKNEKRTK